MARNVTDLAKLLQVQAGHDRRVPLSLSSSFSADGLVCDASQLKNVRIGWLGDLNGYLATEPGILAVCEQALQRIAAQGAIVTPLSLGFDTDRLWQCWLAWRRALAGPRVGELMALPNARLIASLDGMGARENTLVIYMVGDNGASAEGGLEGSTNALRASLYHSAPTSS
jgi:amidase